MDVHGTMWLYGRMLKDADADVSGWTSMWTLMDVDIHDVNDVNIG